VVIWTFHQDMGESGILQGLLKHTFYTCNDAYVSGSQTGHKSWETLFVFFPLLLWLEILMGKRVKKITTEPGGSLWPLETMS
jgi:hypothetical protein